jgi:hypothetical protein
VAVRRSIFGNEYCRSTSTNGLRRDTNTADGKPFAAHQIFAESHPLLADSDGFLAASYRLLAGASCGALSRLGGALSDFGGALSFLCGVLSVFEVALSSFCGTISDIGGRSLFFGVSWSHDGGRRPLTKAGEGRGDVVEAVRRPAMLMVSLSRCIDCPDDGTR